jgi:hypothetical protein
MPSNINFVNNANSGTLTMNAPSPSLTPGTDYGYNGGGGAMSSDTPWLWFNRDVDITNGTTYTFYNTFTFGPITFVITILLTGTALSSNYSIDVQTWQNESLVEDTGAITTVSSTNIPVNIYGLNFNCNVNRFLNGSYDDVTITLSPL